MEEEIKKLWQRWIDKSTEIRRQIGDHDCAAPFVSVRPPSYAPARIPSVLYVGKATRGQWGDRKVPGGPLPEDGPFTPDNLERYAYGWIEQKIWNGGWKRPGPFWYFARSLSKAAASIANDRVGNLENLIWTNICKIGVCSGNPTGEYLRLQEELAVETIRFEIRYYQPRLVVFVTGDFAHRVIDQIVEPSAWETDLGNGYWWRVTDAKLPAMLWTYHPQGKPRDIRKLWLDKAQELTT